MQDRQTDRQLGRLSKCFEDDDKLTQTASWMKHTNTKDVASTTTRQTDRHFIKLQQQKKNKKKIKKK